MFSSKHIENTIVSYEISVLNWKESNIQQYQHRDLKRLQVLSKQISARSS